MVEKNHHLKKTIRIRSDHGKEFKDSLFFEFYNKHGITHEFSVPKKPQHNGVVNQKNKTLKEMARVMLEAKNVPIKF